MEAIGTNLILIDYEWKLFVVLLLLLLRLFILYYFVYINLLLLLSYFRRPEQKHALRQREDIDTLIQDKLYS